MFKIRVGILFTLASMLFTYGQVTQFPEDLKFKHISNEKGLSQSSVYSICQDKYGFIWIGTEEGINRYDGSNIKVFKTIRGDTTSLSDPFTNVIYLDKKGDLWIGTENGLNKFDYSSKTFKRFYFEDKNVAPELTNFITAIIQDIDTNFFVGTNNGTGKFDPETGDFIPIKLLDINKKLISEVFVNTMFAGIDNSIWLGTDKGLFKYHEDDQGDSYFKQTEFSGVSIKDILQKEKNTLWLATNNGLVKFNYEHYSQRVFNVSNSKGLSSDIINSLHFDKQGVFWIGTGGGGINIFDPKENYFKSYKYIKNNSSGLQNDYINTIFEDNSGALWFGTHEAGVEIYERNKKISHLVKEEGKTNTLSSNRVFSIFQDSDDEVWIGTYGGGVNRFNLSTKKITHYGTQTYNSARISSDDITTISESHTDKGKIWIGTKDSGITLLDKNSGKAKFIKCNSGTEGSIPSNEIYSIRADFKGIIWIATSAGLCKFTPSTNSFKTYVHNSEDSVSISGNYCRYIFEDSKRNLWVGTWGNGLNKYNRETDSFTRYLDDQDFSNEELNYVVNISEDSKGNIWIGTYGFGLVKLKSENSKHLIITEAEGLANSTIYSVTEDKQGTLWLTTNYGLSKFNPETLQIKNYYEMDGLLSNEFNDGAFCKLRDGRLMFGSYNGIDIINPSEIKDNDFIPPVIFTSFKKLNQEFFSDRSINELKEIEFSYDDRLISFEFMALNFIRPEKNKYAYRLNGLTDEWIQLGNKNSLTFTSLEPGEYILTVIGSNNDGVWNEQGRTIKIIVKAPFYQTLVFKFLIVLLGVLIFFVVFITHNRNTKKQKETLSKLVAERTSELAKANEIMKTEIEERIKAEEEVSRYVEELQESKDMMEKNAFDLVEINLKIEESEEKLLELNAQKDRFFSIISHDLKSPFVALLGYSEILIEDFYNLSQEELLDFITSINKASKNVYNLLENLLEWSRIQTGRIEYIPEFFNVYKTAENVIDLLRDNAKQKNINLVNSINFKSTVYGDENMINTVLRNLVSNAIKFTREQGEVLISSSDESDFLVVSVSDTGIGMTDSDVDKLFRIDVHHTTIGTNKEKGTGVGLILCKELIEKNGGKIWVESEIDKGSKFIFSLPKKVLQLEETND